jgi:hypothetical protein
MIHLPNSVTRRLSAEGYATGGLDLLGRQSPGAQGAPDQLLVAHHRDLAHGAAAVADVPLPALPTTLGNPADVAVALAGGAGSGLARHRGGARRDDHLGVGCVGGDSAVDRLTVIGAVHQHRTDRALDLVEQRAD